MNILYCGDGNIADGVLMSVLSLLHGNNEPLNVYILTADVNTESRECRALSEEFVKGIDRLIKQYDKNGSAELFNITELFYTQRPAANMETRFTPCCMLRLFADCVKELPDRILYLDNDVICRKDCSDFYHQDIENYELCGVLDYYGRWFFKKNFFRWDYLNSGVLLLNLEYIRRTGLFSRCREMCRTEKMFMPDQSSLNKLSEHKKICERKYNEQRKLHDTTVFQHFTTGFRFLPFFRTVSVKPWDIERVHSVLKLHEYDDLYEQFAESKSTITKHEESNANA